MKRRLRLSQLLAEIKKTWGSCTSIKPSSWSSLTSLTTKQEAKIYKDMGGEDQIHDYIFEYIHKDLRWLIWKHPVSASKLSRPNRYPLSTNNLTGKQIYPGALVYQRTFQFRYSKKGFTV
jgi:hypothetical protein